LFGFVLLFQMTVHIAAPYFNPYMIRHLRLDYTAYMGLIALAFISKLLFLPVIGRWGDRLGGPRLMQVGVFGSILLPVFWVFSSNYIYLAVVQVFSGATWAIFEMGCLLCLFDSISDKQRVSYISIFNLLNACGLLLGTLIGREFLYLM